jgi:aconitate hydratase
MGILPLQFNSGESADSLGLKGTETFTIATPDELSLAQEATVTTSTGVTFTARIRLDTQPEITYYKNGGILSYVLRKLLA